MNGPRRVRINRLVIAGRNISAAAARDLAGQVAEDLGRNFDGSVPMVSQATLSVELKGADGMALGQVARLVARELIRKLLV